MPGLIRGAARVAVVAGTATAVSNRVSRRQANRWSSQGPDGQPEPEPTDEAPPEPEADAAPAPDPIERLKGLGELHEQGILTDEEFASEKAKVLSA
jgi:putative oligomerization/nucleic acid binding protein